MRWWNRRIGMTGEFSCTSCYRVPLKERLTARDSLIKLGTRLLFVARIRLNAVAVGQRSNKHQQGHLADDLIADLEQRLGTITTPYLQIEVSYSHSRLSTAQNCRDNGLPMMHRVATSSVASIERHDARSPWSLRPQSQSYNALLPLLSECWPQKNAWELLDLILRRQATLPTTTPSPHGLALRSPRPMSPTCTFRDDVFDQHQLEERPVMPLTHSTKSAVQRHSRSSLAGAAATAPRIPVRRTSLHLTPQQDQENDHLSYARSQPRPDLREATSWRGSPSSKASKRNTISVGNRPSTGTQSFAPLRTGRTGGLDTPEGPNGWDTQPMMRHGNVMRDVELQRSRASSRVKRVSGRWGWGSWW